VNLLSEAKLDEILRAQNPWWLSGALPQRARHTHERRPDRLLRETERPVLLTGPRRSGKTATLLRLVDAHLRLAERPLDVAYLPLDHPILRLAPLGSLVDRALRLMESKGRPRLLIDGLQALPHWPERFLELIKTRPHPRLVAAASVAPGLQDPAFETVHLPPLGFFEFCGMRGVPELGAPPLDPLDPRLPAQVDSADDHLYHRVLDPVLADYLVRGGFPEAVLEPDLALGHQTVREGVVARAVYQDLPAVVGVLKLADLERVLLAVLLQGGAPLTLEAFADALELDRQTVVRYLEHLGRAYLLTSLKNFAALTDRSRPRLFAVDPALPNALFERGAAVLAQTDDRRSLLAGAVVAHVQRLARERGLDVAYFREGDLEADVVLVSPGGAVPIVIVDKDEVGEEEAALAERIMKRCQARSAFLLSRWGPRRQAALTFFETIYHLPVAYFLYALRA
jgi:predicted AAA+ superfamily ATPase